MPRPLDISAYPPVFQELAYKAPNLRVPVRLSFSQLKDAKRFRYDWYGFIKTLTRYAREEREKGDANGEFAQLLHGTRLLEANLFEGPEGWTLQFTPRHLTWTGRHAERLKDSLDKAFSEQEAQSPPQPLSAPNSQEGYPTTPQEESSEIDSPTLSEYLSRN